MRVSCVAWDIPCPKTNESIPFVTAPRGREPPSAQGKERRNISVTIILILVAALLVAVLALWLFGERWRLIQPSTRRSMQDIGSPRLLRRSSLEGYVYGRWTNQYVNLLINFIFPRLKPRGRRWVSDHYHGKVLTPEHAEALICLDQDIPLRDLEQVIPYPVARDLVLSGPPEVAVYECACRHARAHPCRPTQVCMVVGRPFVDFVLEHNPHSSRRLTQAEALQLLQEEHERGHLHSAWFKDACMDRFYAICNCCKCCCGGIEAMVKYGVPMLASSGYVARVDQSLCSGCGACKDACLFEAIEVNRVASLDWQACMGCGVCVGQCPHEAIALVRDTRKGTPLDVRLLAQEHPVAGRVGTD
jgi:ferredoxin